MSKKVVLHVYPSGVLKGCPIWCIVREISVSLSDAKKLSVDNIRNIVALGYSKRNIKAIYLSKPSLGFEESLVAINSGTEVKELCLLSLILEYVCLYVRHNDETKSDSDNSDAMVDNDFNEYGSDVDDEEVARIIKNKQKLDKDHLVDLEALRDEGVKFISGDAFKTNYQDLDNANSPPRSETDEDGNYERRKGKNRRTTVYPHYKERTTKDGVHLEAGMMLVDKKQLKEAIEDYQMYNRHGLKTVKSDTGRLYLVCKVEGFEWTWFASTPQGEKSFQIKNMPIPHSCVPYSFERVFFKGYAKCDSINNNMAEIFNAFIIEHRFKPMPLSSASSSTVAAAEPSTPPQSAAVVAQLASDSTDADASVGDTTYSIAASNAYVHRQLGKLPVKRALRTSQSGEGVPTQESQTLTI
ncbi:hypothetical protein Cgig2_025524 [Carnegiea gigantea]|uniref:Transposase MuDR plant domain-containing protein n=1 Tax=Carnegiea gigantea TaxID=171969 RepID=A0A9Q1QCJ4_9CARY|nr:hypothetical protein Cgig2_025524 [Carnegiea gigantea]